MDATSKNDWYQWDASHFDRLPKSVRAAIRSYPINIDCAKLRKMAKTEQELLRILAEQRAPI